MPHRIPAVLTALAGLAGLAVVGVLVLRGRDIRQAASTGPRWRRKLVSATMVLLGLAGLLGCKKFRQGPPVPTCYAPPPMPQTALATRPSSQTITAQLDLIEKQIQAGQVPRDALASRLDQLAQEARLLARVNWPTEPTDPGQAHVPPMPLVAIEARASMLWARVHGDPQAPLAANEDWQAVLAFWHYAQPLVGGSTYAQRSMATDMQQRAQQGLKTLSQSGLLDASEAGLLSLESQRLMARIVEGPPVDCVVTCYDMAPVVPARESLERLSARVDLLEAAARDGRIDPAVAERILGTIQSDLAVLSNEEQIKQVNAEEQAKARSVSGRITAALGRVQSPTSAP